MGVKSSKYAFVQSINMFVCYCSRKTTLSHTLYMHADPNRILSSSHASGEQLGQVSGIAAVLRFPLPELEEVDEEEEGTITPTDRSEDTLQSDEERELELASKAAEIDIDDHDAALEDAVQLDDDQDDDHAAAIAVASAARDDDFD